MAVIASDTFTRANGALAGSTTEVGSKTWALEGTSTGWNVVSGQVAGPVNTSASLSLIAVPAYTSGTELVTVSCVAQLANGGTCAGVYLGTATGYGLSLIVEQGIFTGGPMTVQLVGWFDYGYNTAQTYTPAGLAYNTPVSLSMTVDPTNQMTTVVCNGVTLWTGAMTGFIGNLPWNAGLATYQNTIGKIDDFWVGTPGAPVATGFAAVGSGSSSTVDMIVSARTVTGDSLISVSTSATASIFRTTTTGVAPVNVGSSSPIPVIPRTSSVIASDTFTRGTGTSIAGSVTEVGAKTWVGNTYYWKISGGKAAGPSGGSGWCLVSIPIDAADVIAPMKISAIITPGATSAGNSSGGIYIGSLTGSGVLLQVTHNLYNGGLSIHLGRSSNGASYASALNIGVPAGLAYGVPATYTMTVNPVTGLVVCTINGTQFYSGTETFGVLPWRAGLGAYNGNLGGVTVDNWVLTSGPEITTGTSTIGAESSSTVDMIVSARTVTGDSLISMSTIVTASIFSTTITGVAPVNVMSSTMVALNITNGTSAVSVGSSSVVRLLNSKGTSAVGIVSSSIVTRIFGPSSTYTHEWTAATGLDGTFVYPSGMSVDAVNFPAGSAGSLRWPAGPLGHSINIPVTLDLFLVASGTVTFWRKTSSESGYDKLRFYIDGVEKFGDSGELTWLLKTYAVADGMHQFKWAYTKDSSATVGQDTVWIAQLSISGIAIPPPPSTGMSSITAESSSLVSILVFNETSGMAPVCIESLSTGVLLYFSITDGVSSVDIGSTGLSGVLNILSSYDGENSDILVPILLTGIIDPIYPEPVPPVDFDGLPDPTVAPIVIKSDTASGNLPPGDYRYAYAAWLHSEGQATAPSPWSEIITLTTDDTVTLTYPVIPGAKGYIVYREEV